MCYAIPARIEKIEGDSAEVDYGGVIKRVNIRFIDSAALGDYVLVHAGFAIEKLEGKSALESLEIIREMIAFGEGREKRS